MAIFTEILLCFSSSEIVNYPVRSKNNNNKKVHFKIKVTWNVNEDEKINQQNAQINSGLILLLINHYNMFRPLSRSHHQGVRNPWELQSHCIDLLECCYVYVFASRYDSCGMLRLRGRNMLEWLISNKINPELICAFCWFIFSSSLLKMHGPKKQKTKKIKY